VRLFVGEDLNFGLILGIFIMTMPLLMTRSLSTLKGHRFSDIADIQGHAMTILQGIPEEEFQKCFEQCRHRLTKCIGEQGDYFEGVSNH
jgi:hypothetical protein